MGICRILGNGYAMLRSVSRHLEPAYGAFTRSQALDEQVSLIVINRLRVFGAGVSKTTEFHQRADH